MTTGAIFGDWTHRRRDAGGTRALEAEVARARPEIAWAWRPSHAGAVDQLRVVQGVVHVATMAPSDPDAPGWEHATIFALEAPTGRVVAQRTLPDPAPVAALAVDGGLVQVVATRKGEPIFVYALGVGDLRPRGRRRVTLDRDERREDVLDVWAVAGGALWLEMESAFGGARAYAWLDDGAAVAVTQTHAEDLARAGWGAPARDACSDGRALFAPLAGVGPEAADEGRAPQPPALWRVAPQRATPHEVESRRSLLPPAQEPWATFDLTGARSQAHALAADGLVTGVAAAMPNEREERAVVQAIAVDRATGLVRVTTPPAELRLRGGFGDAARLVRRPDGEVLFQRLAEGVPCSDVARVRPDGTIETMTIEGGRHLALDAALGSLVLAHHEADDGRVTVVALDLDRERGLLRRSHVVWSVETPDLGGGTTVYAGAGHVLVRGNRQVVALRP